jgi:hypothetical protein
MIGSLLIATTLLFAGCSDEGADEAATDIKTHSVPSKGLIKADPNPVPAGTGLGKATISWDIKSEPGPVAVYVSMNDAPEVLFATGQQQGNSEAAWIQANAVYDFRLYVGTDANKKLLDHVEVTRSQ